MDHPVMRSPVSETGDPHLVLEMSLGVVGGEIVCRYIAEDSEARPGPRTYGEWSCGPPALVVFSRLGEYHRRIKGVRG